MEYCGIDIHVSYSQICILKEEGDVMETSRVRTSPPALTKFFSRRDRLKIVIEAGGSSPWVWRHLEELGHEVLVCSPRGVRLIAESTLKNDKVDAEVLARLLRMDPAFLAPIRHHTNDHQCDRNPPLVRRGADHQKRPGPQPGPAPLWSLGPIVENRDAAFVAIG